MAALSPPTAASSVTHTTTLHDTSADQEPWDLVIPPLETASQKTKTATYKTSANSRSHRVGRNLASTAAPRSKAGQGSVYRQQSYQDIGGRARDGESVQAVGINPTQSAGMAPVSKRRAANGLGTKAAPDDESKWIHRDKLAQIESREMAEAGILMPHLNQTARSSTARSSSTSKRSGRQSGGEPGRDTELDEEDLDYGDAPRWNKIDTAEERRGTQDRPRTPDGYDSTPPYTSSSSRHGQRPSTSRIPVAKNSPGQTYHSRESSFSRSRGNSIAQNGTDDEGFPRMRHHSRNGSVGSQVMLDDADDMPQTYRSTSHPNPTQPSSPRGKNPNYKTMPASGGRKNIRDASNQNKARTPSRETQKRPGTSGGASRPSTANRPEGEAPWIATMFKPDPMLPPDQQMLPTHAKRIAQQQWAKDAAPTTVPDKDSQTLNAPVLRRPSPEKYHEAGDADGEDDEQWPLPSPTKARSPEPSYFKEKPLATGKDKSAEIGLRPSDKSKEQPKQESQPQNTSLPEIPSTRRPEPVRLPEPPESEKTEKKCGCCVVM